MKKTKFYITMSGKTPTAKQVDGYFVFIDGVALGLHRYDKTDHWTVSELSTGFKITDGKTREKALKNAMPFLDKVKETICKDRCRYVKEIIKAAYAA